MSIVQRIDKKSNEWTTFEKLFSSRCTKPFKKDMLIVERIDKKSNEWTKFESLFSSRRKRVFKSDTRTAVHVDVEGTGKRLIFIAKDDGTFYHYMEDYWHPDASQGDPTCIYEWQNNVSSY